MARQTASTTKPATEPVAEEVNTNGEIIKAPSKFRKEDLQAATTFDEYVALTAEVHGGVIAVHETELGDGFRVADDEAKGRLVGVPIMLMEWSFNAGDYSDFVSIRLVAQTESGLGKWVVNDGGTGIYKDLKDFTEKTGRFGGLYCRNGFRVSHYMIGNEKGEAKYGEPLNKREVKEYMENEWKVAPAATYYLDTSA